MSSECPVCSKQFPLSDIQNHVEKCIFLLDQSHVETKRQMEQSASTAPKRLKTAPTQESPSRKTTAEMNLADSMRPNSLSEYFGQSHILSDNSSLRSLLEKNCPPSMILWGPPGCGKTTLAHIINNTCKQSTDVRFVKLSATLAGVNDVKEAVKVASNELKMFKRRTILFMDEIHRFNKLQLDIFLPSVESGIITLIGATTENPSFSLNSALLSRCRVFVLEKLTMTDIMKILQRAVLRLEQTKRGLKIDDDGLDWLAHVCDGDARIALNSLQLAVDSSPNSHVTTDHIKEGVKRSHMLYDRKGEEHYNIISAVHKSIRASDDNAALYWLCRMLEGGEDPMFIARRLVRAASEDIGLADPSALTKAVSAMQAVSMVGSPECDVFLAQTAVYLARAPKSQEVYVAMKEARRCIVAHQGPLPSVPLHLRNAPTRLMSELGYGRGYNMLHKDESNLQYMPDGMESVNFFKPNHQ